MCTPIHTPKALSLTEKKKKNLPNNISKSECYIKMIIHDYLVCFTLIMNTRQFKSIKST